LEIVTIDMMLSKLTSVCCTCPTLEAARRELSNASREYKETIGIPMYSMSSPVGGVAFYTNMAAGLRYFLSIFYILGPVSLLES
jgi:hypothetical protein